MKHGISAIRPILGLMAITRFLTVGGRGDSLCCVRCLGFSAMRPHAAGTLFQKGHTQPEIEDHPRSRDDLSGTPGVGGGKSAANFSPDIADLPSSLTCDFVGNPRQSRVNQCKSCISERQQYPNPVGLIPVFADQTKFAKIFDIAGNRCFRHGEDH